MFKILCIGNSFSEDSTKYLYDIAVNGGMHIKVVNLYIGGCSLERHWNNMLENKADYNYQLNGTRTDQYVTIKDALIEEDWDVVTMQQCSGYSGVLESYYPYIRELSKYILEYAENAKQMIHQTWAYEINSTHDHFAFYQNDQDIMFQKLSECYDKVAKELSLDIIPFGTVIQSLRKIPPFDYKNGGKSLCRDGFHMDLLYGRYALAATWYEAVLHGNILSNTFDPSTEEDTEVDKSDLNIIKQCVHKMISRT